MKNTPCRKLSSAILCCLVSAWLGTSQTGCILVDTVVPHHANVGEKIVLRTRGIPIHLSGELYAKFDNGDLYALPRTGPFSSVIEHDQNQLEITVPSGIEGETVISLWSGDSLVSSPFPFRIDTVPYDVRILAFGDSLVRNAFHSHLLDKMLNREICPALVINEGLGGETLQEGALRLETVLSFHKGVGYIYLLEGANDISDNRNTPIGTMIASLAQMIDLIQDAGIHPIVMTTPPRSGPSLENDQTSPTTEEWNRELISYSAAHGIQLVDLYGAFVAEPAWESLLSKDGLHLSKTGWELTAEKLYAAFSPLLQ